MQIFGHDSIAFLCGASHLISLTELHCLQQVQEQRFIAGLRFIGLLPVIGREGQRQVAVRRLEKDSLRARTGRDIFGDVDSIGA
jgi:hypothetical protein